MENRYKLIALIITFGLNFHNVNGNNLMIENLSFKASTNTLSFTVSWENSWRDATGDFRDAVWLFVKYKNAGGQWQHGNLASGTPPIGFSLDVASDKTGAMIYRNKEGYGNVNSDVISLQLDVTNGPIGPFPDFKLFGIEMVYIPQGPFYFGGPISDYDATRYFHKGNDFRDGLLIQSEASLAYGTSSDNWFIANESADFQDIPASFPKGFNAFHCMKYEITQGQYVDFLNTLTPTQQSNRVYIIDLNIPYALTGYDQVAGRNCVRYVGESDDGNYTFGCDLNENGTVDEPNDGNSLACNYIKDEDLMAYLDWAALRPMTRLELFKICRGPSLPVEDEFAWGNPFINQIGESELTLLGSESENQISAQKFPYGSKPMRSGFAATASSNRSFSGATYYGVMEMSGSVAEILVDIREISNPSAFTGTYGDGVLSTSGFKTNQDWKANGASMGPGNSFTYYTLSEVSSGIGSSGSRSSKGGGRGVR